MPVLKIENIEHFARMLALPKFVLTRYVFQSDRHYKRFRIRKRSDHGYRIISAPSSQMKGLQRWITAFILRKLDVSPFSTAFREGCSITENARPHVGKDFVFNTDIKDFFPSITSKRVYGFFRSVGYPTDVAFALARLTTSRGRLPQGAPSSPDIANLLCRKLDLRVGGLCSTQSWSYTRYCDDMTISGEGHFTRGFQRNLERIVHEEGFHLNRTKTRIGRRNSRQMVTGLVVNAEVHVPRYKRRRWRAVFHQAALDPQAYLPRIAELEGYCNFLQMITPSDPALVRFRATICDLQKLCQPTESSP